MIVRKICCIGADTVGGPFSCVVANKCPEVEVRVVDQNEEKIKRWNSSRPPVPEGDLADMVINSRGKNLFFTCEAETAIKEADIVFICMNTEMKTEGQAKGRTPNLKPLEDAARLIAKHAASSKIIVEKSTIPIRAAETLTTVFKAHHQTGRTFIVLSNPEFLSEGTMVNDLLYPKRVLIGGSKSASGRMAVETLISIYKHWVPRENILTADVWSAELAKLATSAVLAQRISSINSLSEVCEATNADVSQVAAVVGMDSRIGSKGLVACLGFGGPNITKDILNLVYLCESLNLPLVAKYWQKVVDLNEHQKARFSKRIIQTFFNTLSGKHVAILGFSYKKNSADTTDSPALVVCTNLLQEGAKLYIYDPVVPKAKILKDLKPFCETEEKLSSSVTVTDEPYEATAGAHVIVVCTDWDQFATLDYFKIFNEMMKPAYVFDGWNVLPHSELAEIGFKVHTIGKNVDQPPVPPADAK